MGLNGLGIVIEDGVASPLVEAHEPDSYLLVGTSVSDVAGEQEHRQRVRL
jgi:hypothetical protein